MTRLDDKRLAFFLPSLAGGGAERVVLNLAAGFANRGIRTDLVLANAEGPYLELIPPNIRLVDLEASRMLGSLSPLVRYIRRERPQTLLSALDHANLVALAAVRLSRTATRTVISIHCGLSRPVRGHSSVRLTLIQLLAGFIYHRADNIVTVSAGVADDVARRTWIPRERIDVVYNPVITPDLLPAAAEPPSHPWFEDIQHPIVLGVGRLTPQKNFPLLIEAFAVVRREHRNARLVILGEGQERETLEALVRNHGIEDSVALPGFVANPHACIARAAVFVLSSDFEGLPTVLIESLAIGTPVVATDCESGPKEILRNGELGELVPVRHVAALARAIGRALSNPPRAVRAEELQQYTLDAVLDRFQATFHLRA